MDMYQKRKMRQEKKNSSKNNGVEKIQLNWYPGHMAKTKRLIKEKLDLVDIVLEVIDSRIPKSSKIKDIDDIVKNKKRIIIMTKYDMCDRGETDKWIKYYENLGYKVIATNLLNDTKILNKVLEYCNELLDDFNKKRMAKGLAKRKVRALVIGVPNVGKSTLINKLVGKRSVSVGNMPGVTKNLNWIRINDNIELLDSPGILWPKFDNEVALNLASMTSIKEEILPIDRVCIHILNKLNDNYKDLLIKRYGIEYIDNDDIISALDIIGKKRGCLIKGGEINYDKVCILVLRDMRDGLIGNVTFDRMM